MPLGKHGSKVMKSFMERYGSKKGKSVAYAKANKEGKGSKFFQLMHAGK